MKKAKDLLNNTTPVSNTINEDAMVIDAFNLMEAENLDYVIVKERGVCIGIISEVDYMNKIILAQKNPNNTKIKDIITGNVYTVNEEVPVHKCIEMMNTFKIRHLLVFEASQFKGVIRLHDLIRAAFQENNVEAQLEKEQVQYFVNTSKAPNQPQNMSFDNS